MKTFTLFLFTVLSSAGLLFGQYGYLDTTFDGDGKVVTMLNGNFLQCSQVIPLDDGKIIVAGTGTEETENDFLLIRYNEDGSIDDSFGDNGFVFTSVSDQNDEVLDAVADADGNYLLAGRVYVNDTLHVACVRYLADGSPDNTFGTGGMVTFRFGTGYVNQAYAIVLQDDGKILLAGSSGNPPDMDFAVARLNTDGTPDTTFGNNGIVTTDLDDTSDEAFAVGVDSDGKIVLAGHAFYTDNNEMSLAIVRYNSDGSTDSSFGTNGKIIEAFTPVYTAGRALAVLENNKVLVSGWVDTDNNYDIFIAKYNADGTPDVDFGNNGLVTEDFGSWETVWRMVVQDDGKILCANSRGIGMDSDFALYRYNADGTNDETFGENGLVLTDFLGLDYALGLAITNNGKIVAGGTTKETLTGISNIAIARYISGTATGVEEQIAGIRQITAYPNPATDRVILHVELLKKTGMTLRLFNLQGEQLPEQSNLILEKGSNTLPVNLQGLAPGLYFYRLTETATGKMVSGKIQKL